MTGRVDGRRASLRPLLLLVTAAVVSGCNREPRAEDPSPADQEMVVRIQESDTLRGRVALVGPHPTAQVTVQSGPGEPQIFLEGDQALVLHRVDGTEAWIAGRWLDERRFEVRAFEVRAVDGIAAEDGILMNDVDGLLLLTADGRRLAVRDAPPALRALVGARVWISGPLDRAPEAWGVIEPAP